MSNKKTINNPITFKYFGADLVKDFGDVFKSYGYDPTGLFDNIHGYDNNVYDVLSKIKNINNNQLQGEAVNKFVGELNLYNANKGNLQTFAFKKGVDGSYIQSGDVVNARDHASKYYSPSLTNTVSFLENNNSKLGLSNDGLAAQTKLEQSQNAPKIFDDRLIYTAMATAGISSLAQIGGNIFAWKAYEQQKKFNENQLKLAVENYRNEAKAYNFNLASTLSGRVHNGMSEKSLRQLQNEYQGSKVRENAEINDKGEVKIK